MSAETINHGCTKCGRLVVTDVPRVGVSFTPAEVASLARDTLDPKLQARLLCALGSVDIGLEQRVRMELAGDEAACPSCVELRHDVEHLEKQIRELSLDLEDRDRRLEDARDRDPTW